MLSDPGFSELKQPSGEGPAALNCLKVLPKYCSRPFCVIPVLASQLVVGSQLLVHTQYHYGIARYSRRRLLSGSYWQNSENCAAGILSITDYPLPSFRDLNIANTNQRVCGPRTANVLAPPYNGSTYGRLLCYHQLGSRDQYSRKKYGFSTSAVSPNNLKQPARHVDCYVNSEHLSSFNMSPLRVTRQMKPTSRQYTEEIKYVR